MYHMEGLSLKRRKSIDISKCIIYQNDKSNTKLGRTADGRTKLINVAAERQDCVNEHIQSINAKDIKYHVDNDIVLKTLIKRLIKRLWIH